MNARFVPLIPGSSSALRMRILTPLEAQEMGYSADKRRRRRQHRTAARQLLRNGGFFNNYSAPGSMFWEVAQWHKAQARSIR